MGSLKKPIEYKFDLNTKSQPKTLCVTHTDDNDVDVIKLIVTQGETVVDLSEATVTARMVMRWTHELLNDNVSCEYDSETGSIMIPIDNAVIPMRAGEMLVEVNILSAGADDKSLSLQFPLIVRVNGSILGNAEVTPDSRGTIPELLQEVEQELERVQGFVTEAQVFEILDNALSGNRNISPTLLVDNVVDQTHNPNGDLIMYYIDSDWTRHNVFDFTPYLENYVSSAVVNQNGTITFTLDDGSTFTTTGSSVIGSDGFSPTISTSPGYLRTRVEITDVNGTQYFYINDGESVKSAIIDANGDLKITIQGKPSGSVRPTYPERIYNVGHVVGADGYSPTATVTQTQSGATVSITDKNGTTTANISNGTNGSDYILTAQDKSDIADLVLAELPTTQGVQYGNTGN